MSLRRRLIAEAASTKQKIKALYNYVTSKIRYIGLQFGEIGYKPYLAVEIFKNKYGVCKEKATLLIAMLREIGVKAEPVLIRRGFANIDLNIASPALFNHMIVYLPAQDKYIDPTSSGTMYGVLPGDQGKNVLLPEKNKLTATPIKPPQKNGTLIKQQVTLTQRGTAEIVYQEKYTGRQRKRLLKRGLSRGFSKVQVNGIQLAGVKTLRKPLRIQISDIKAQNYAKNMGIYCLLSPFTIQFS